MPYARFHSFPNQWKLSNPPVDSCSPSYNGIRTLGGEKNPKPNIYLHINIQSNPLATKSAEYTSMAKLCFISLNAFSTHLTDGLLNGAGIISHSGKYQLNHNERPIHTHHIGHILCLEATNMDGDAVTGTPMPGQ